MFFFIAGFDSYYIVVAMYFDYRLWADNGTHSTAGTIGVVCLGREVTIFIGLPGDDDAVVGTYYYAQAATFAPFGIDYNFASHFAFFCLCLGFKLRDSNRAGCLCKVKRQLIANYPVYC